MSLFARLLGPSARWATVVLLACIFAYVAKLSFPSTEAVRLRNALLLEEAHPGDFDWSPSHVPADFKLDRGPSTQLFERAAQDLKLESESSEWRRGVAIAHHLRSSMRDFGPIFGDLENTYLGILQGGGYCADATDAFLALAKAGGLFARQWAFSFDGYGGHGHAVVEVYDSQLKQWVFLDPYNNFYVEEPQTGRPLSVSELRDALRSNVFDKRLLPIVPEYALDVGNQLAYYRRGIEQWYLWWGNNVQALDEYSLPNVALFLPGKINRGIDQLVAALRGDYPALKVVRTHENQALVDRMLALEWKLLVLAAAGLALSGLLGVQTLAAIRRKRHQHSRHGGFWEGAAAQRAR